MLAPLLDAYSAIEMTRSIVQLRLGERLLCRRHSARWHAVQIGGHQMQGRRVPGCGCLEIRKEAP